MAKMNYQQAAKLAKPSTQACPTSKNPSSSWNDTRTQRQRQIEQWRRARECLKNAGALPPN